MSEHTFLLFFTVSELRNYRELMQRSLNNDFLVPAQIREYRDNIRMINRLIGEI